jgi:hypothetical protein
LSKVLLIEKVRMADKSPEERAAMVKQFGDVTGVDEERARFYLEASGWELQVGTKILRGEVRLK